LVQDYKNAPGKRAPAKQGLPRWAVLLILLIVAAFVAFLYFLNEQLPVADNPLEVIKPRTDVRIPNRPEVKPQQSEPESKQSASPKFEFYNVLPELEVVLPQVESLFQSAEPKPEPVEKAKPKTVLKEAPEKVIEATPVVKPKPAAASNKTIRASYLQVGSFKRREDAERRQVELILLGLEAKIQDARIKGAAWYRVRLGPYRSSAEISRAKTKLRKNRVDFLLIKG